MGSFRRISRTGRWCLPAPAARCLAHWAAVAVIGPFFAQPGAPARAAEAVDLELVLSIDASGSVDDDEYRLQLGGIAAAFRDPAIMTAISGGVFRRIAVAVVIWAGASEPRDTTEWWIIGAAADALAFAAMAEARPRVIKGGTTGIGAGVAASIELAGANDIIGRRTVIDVSGDGKENSAPGNFLAARDETDAISRAREEARARGITINGLAILNDVHDLDQWYDAHVRSGPDSFVMVAEDYSDFTAAMLAKLVREIGSGPAVTDLGGGLAAGERTATTESGSKRSLDQHRYSNR
jgi:hypothetical protein